jgi:two-component system NtrC family sensor kinase
MVAHDLRNPLQGIAASAYYVKKKTEGNGDEKLSAMIKYIEDSVKYSDKIIRDLLDYSGEQKVAFSETDPSSLIKQALSRTAIPEKIKLNDKTEDNPKIQVDVDALKRVIRNLINNAFDAMPDGGTLTITSKKNKDNLEIKFADTGVGIPREKMERLWTPFVTTKAKGMGLGLPMCKRIVDAHHGNMLVETQSGKGTTVTLLLPLQPQKETDVAFLVAKPQEVILKENEKTRLLTYFQ